MIKLSLRKMHDSSTELKIYEGSVFIGIGEADPVWLLASTASFECTTGKKRSKQIKELMKDFQSNFFI